MTGRNEPLLEILQVLVSVTQNQLPGSITCVSVIQDGRLRDVVAPQLPKPFLETAYPRGAIVPRMDLATHRNEALKHGLADCWSQEVLSSAGNQIGCVDVYLDKHTPLGEAQTALLEGIAKLAGIVIQHREMYEQLAFQATRDPLTDLPNRRLFQDRLEQAIARRRGWSKSVSGSRVAWNASCSYISRCWMTIPTFNAIPRRARLLALRVCLSEFYDILRSRSDSRRGYS